MRIFGIVALFFILNSPISILANVDADAKIKESKKCSELFASFEKKYNIPKNTLHAISLQETRRYIKAKKMGIAWPWTVNVQGKGYHFDSKQEAIEFVRKKQKAGIKSIDVGCMQINLKHHPKAFESLEEAFKPRKNIEYAAKMLRNNYKRTKNWCFAIGHYHSKTPSRSCRYHASVAKNLKSMNKHISQLNNNDIENESIRNLFKNMQNSLTNLLNA